ncbi:ribonuclease PH [Nakamurella aerolata]|uniref:Ribonuclease PH n=1 Tax=Nakamurella aerolata TaxID=1656892 RepID=A0A849A8E9_9ACTN|nr:ribonuclease PH [Nakamurella aerolata]NNG37244.1 ribonuclease PH [Nakamurella aerolata]
MNSQHSSDSSQGPDAAEKSGPAPADGAAVDSAADRADSSTAGERRADGRADDELRPITFTRGFQAHPAGSVLVEFGGTKVLCAASVTQGVPRWRKGSGLGWLTAEYAMLPSATHDRSDRESVKGRVGGRTHEISRLIGRSLRACIDLSALGENTIALDCDVLQADGGTRTAAISGAYVALADAVHYLRETGALADPQPLSCQIAAVSVGVVGGKVRLDLPYAEDAGAEVDMNVVATDAGMLVEIQGTAENATFPRRTLDAMLDSALAGIHTITQLQSQALAAPYPKEIVK